MRYRITVHWDAEAAVWIATSDDVPGLVLESGSFDALLERVKQAAPELIALNGTQSTEYKLDFTAEREEPVVAYG